MDEKPADSLTEAQLDQLDLIAQLSYLLRSSGATICFCTVCSHDRRYGYCWSCRCHNHAKEAPALDTEGTKVKAALDRWMDLAKGLHADLEALKGAHG